MTKMNFHKISMLKIVKYKKTVMCRQGNHYTTEDLSCETNAIMKDTKTYYNLSFIRQALVAVNRNKVNDISC